MFHWLVGGWRTVGFVASSTVLIYLSTILGVRTSERRTLSEMSPFDFVVAVAIGAIVGRTATTPSPSYVQGAAAVLTLVIAHRLLGWVRLRSTGFRRTVERSPLVLVSDGSLVGVALRRAHLTDEDVYSALREHGVRSLGDVRLLILEPSGRFSLIERDNSSLDPRLLSGVRGLRKPPPVADGRASADKDSRGD